MNTLGNIVAGPDAAVGLASGPAFEYLDLERVELQPAPDGTLRLLLADRCGLNVEPFRAFPLSHPEEYIVLRDGAGQELGILRDLRQVAEPNRTRLRDLLRRRYFLPRITAILEITERFGSSVWDLQTDRGRCTVTTRQMNEAVFEVETGRYIITDVEGNRYEVKDLSALDPESRGRFFGKF